jgi:DNA repair protein RadC
MTIELSDKQKIKLLNSDDVYTVMQGILLREEKIDQETEHFWMIGLANNNRILYIELVSLGSVNAVTVEPMNVFRVAVLKGAVKAIIAHNHPSGELKPSDADKDLTDRLIQVGRILNIPVIDHLIISVNSYLSFVDTGLFEQLEDSTKWVPAFELIERIKKEEKKIRDQAVQEEKEKTIKKVVKNARRKGLSVDDIAELTGLTPEEIAKIK